jgi:hypothetical protein
VLPLPAGLEPGLHSLAALAVDNRGKALFLTPYVEFYVTGTTQSSSSTVVPSSLSVGVDHRLADPVPHLSSPPTPTQPAAAPSASLLPDGPRRAGEGVAAYVRRWTAELGKHEWGLYSQNGEDGVLAAILARVGVTRARAPHLPTALAARRLQRISKVAADAAGGRSEGRAPGGGDAGGGGDCSGLDLGHRDIRREPVTEEATQQWDGGGRQESAGGYYVEFGVEDGSECNTRLLRERYGWSGLLMDGGYHRPEINLHK